MEDMRTDMLKEQRHERLMRVDLEYFVEDTLENFSVSGENMYFPVYYGKLKRHCRKYDQDVNVVLEALLASQD